jgi:hypothetical protein
MNGARQLGGEDLRIVIAIINDWIYKRNLKKKIIIVRYSFDESTAL